MDDDDLRRGRPTCHVKYGEDIAILAGDGLYAEAFRHLLQHQRAEPANLLAAAAELATATGVNGMVGGQYIDVRGLVPHGDVSLRRLHELKTGRLIAASVECVLLLTSDEASATRLAGFRAFAAELGVLFQIVDDILDVTGTEDALGKPQGSDERHGKLTYVSQYGVDGARRMAADSHRNAREALRAGGRRGGARAHHGLHLHAHVMTKLLDRIDKPQDLHGLTEDELQQVAQEVRELLIDTVGEIGGHFGANLGACEIAVAVHSLLDSPARQGDLGRRPPGLPAQGPHRPPRPAPDDPQVRAAWPRSARSPSPSTTSWAPATPSTAIGYAVGLKEAMRHGAGEDGKVVAVVGDGAMTGGVAFEAVHQAGGLGTPIVVILNDNGMSIAPNVGALCRYFNRVRLDPGLWKAREGVEEKLTRLPGGIGARFERLGPQLKESVKALWQPGLWWEELDWAYMGVIDGHDVRAVRKALSAAFEAERPVVIHVATVKGKGFAPAEEGGLEGMEKWHAAKPKSIEHRRPAPSKPKKKSVAPPQYTQVFGEAMVRECERDERVVGITAAMNSGTGLSILQKAMPDRYFDVGIAEQQAVLFAAGLALQGMRPVAAIYSTFLQRAFDQIVHDVCLQNLNVTFCMDRAGLVGDDGPTHHGAFDIAYLRPLPNITLMAPRDEAMLVHMLHTALQIDGPAAIRYPRGEAEGVAIPAEPTLLEVGTGEILREGERVAIVGYGSGVGKALGAADLLAEHGLDVTVADARFAKPLDAGLLAQLAAEHDLLVTVEEGVLMGGFGSAVWESLSDGGAAPRMLRVGLPDRYVTHGAPKLLHEEVGFTAERIAERIEAAVLEPRGSLV